MALFSFRTICHFLWKSVFLTIALILIFMAVCIDLAQEFTPVLNHHRQDLEVWLSKRLDYPIHISHFRASWQQLAPTCQLEALAIFEPKSNKLLGQVRHLTLSLDLWQSAWHRRLIFKTVTLSGIDLIIERPKSGPFRINGVSLAREGHASHALSHLLINLQHIGSVALSDVNVVLSDEDHFVLPLMDLSLHFFAKQHQHHLVVNAYLNLQKTHQIKLIASLSGKLQEPKTLSSRAYIDLTGLELSSTLLNAFDRFGQIQSGNLNVQAWVRVRAGELKEIKSLMALDGLRIASEKNEPITVESLTGSAQWDKWRNNWRLAFDKLNVKIDKNVWPLHRLALRHVKTDSKIDWVLNWDTIELKQLMPFVLKHFSNMIRPADVETLKKLNLRGEFYNSQLQLSMPETQNDLLPWQQRMHAQLGYRELHWQSIDKLPGVSHLSGLMDWQPDFMGLLVNTPKLNITDKQLFGSTLKLNDVFLRLQRKKTRELTHYILQQAELHAPGLSVAASGNLWQQLGAVPKLSLWAGVNLTALDKAKEYFPRLVMSPKLKNWLDNALVAGEVSPIQFVWRGPLQNIPYPDRSGELLGWFHLQNASLQFHPKWPPVTGLSTDFLWHNEAIQLTQVSGQIRKIPVENAFVTVSPLGDNAPTRLTLKVQQSVPLDAGLDLIRHAPLKKILGPRGLPALSAKGDVDADLNLGVPVSRFDLQPETVALRLTAKNSALQFSLKSLKLLIDQITGQVYVTEKGVSGKNLQARLLGGRAHFSLQTREQSGDSVTDITSSGRLQLTSLQQAINFPLLHAFSGRSDYRALLQFHKSAAFWDSLSLNLPLRGATIDLPAPFNKSQKGALQPLNFHWWFGHDNKMRFALDLLPKLSARLQFRDEPGSPMALESGAVHLNWKTPRARFQQRPGLVVNAYFPTFDWSRWQAFFPKESSHRGGEIPIRDVHIQMDNFLAFNQVFHQITARVTPEKLAWFAQIKSQEFSGNITVPQKPTDPIRLNLSFLKLAQIADKSETTFSPRDLPALNVAISSLSLAQYRIGAVQFALRPVVGGTEFNNVHITNAYGALHFSGRWLQVKSHDSSAFTGSLETPDLGDLLRYLSLSDNMHEAAANIAFNLAWQASPFHLDLPSLTGDLSFKLGQGTIVGLSQSTNEKLGLVGLMNILSLQSLPRRLSLNFNDLTKKGYTFDIGEGKLVLREGSAYTQEAFLKGPAARVSATGRLGFVKKEYDLKLKVVPYVTSSLPVIATIAGGPVAGAVTWVADQVLSREVNRFTEHVYLITGTWDKPHYRALEKSTESNKGKAL